MQLSDASALAHQEMKRHGLIELGWTFGFDQGTRRFGCCRYTVKKITLSRKLTLANEEYTVLMTILHEIAHALHINAGYRPGHDAAWARICADIGGQGTRIIQGATPVPRRTRISITDIGG